MRFKSIGKSVVQWKGVKICLIIFSFLIHDSVLSQMVTLSLKDEPIVKAFKTIEAQTNYRFIYSKESIAGAKTVTIQVENVALKDALNIVFSGQPLGYTIEDRYIMVKVKEEKTAKIPFQNSGRVLDEEDNPIAGVTVMVKGSSVGTTTDANGIYLLKNIDEKDVLRFSFVGKEGIDIAINGQSFLLIHLKTISQSLDETIIQAYGTTTRRLSTGNISKLSASEISKQAVTNPLAAMQGRVPGLIITQSSGIAGSSFKVQLRGRTTIDPSITDDQPLFIIDGIPYASNNGYLNTFNSALGTPSNLTGTVKPGGLSPFASINPQDIESIEVLKDADATAIYGSRGANGVVLITTKKGKAGKTGLSFSLQSGWSEPTRMVRMLNTTEYVQMRKEAFYNDSLSNPAANIKPTTANAYDLLVWDSGRYTDLKKLLIGKTARSWDAQASVSGGTEGTRFLIGGNYHRETDVFAGDLGSSNASVHLNLSHTSGNAKFSAALSASYASAVNQSFSTDLTSLLEIPPTILVYDSSGRLGWNEGGLLTGWNNPLSYVYSRYTAETNNLLSNLNLAYKVTNSLSFKLNSGFHSIDVEEKNVSPMSSLNPLQNPGRSASFSTRAFKSYIIEPHLSYLVQSARNRFDVLLGGTWQFQKTDLIATTGSGYVDDAMLGSLSGAGSITGTKSFTEYKYEALFARINYAYNKKYILNFSARRDGSSRFGDDRRFASFGSLGGAWIFSDEPFFQKAFGVFSFGKLRGSAGTYACEIVQSGLSLGKNNQAGTCPGPRNYF